jgi:hypothetical protein
MNGVIITGGYFTAQQVARSWHPEQGGWNEMRDPYGYIRAHWDINPHPYIARYGMNTEGLDRETAAPQTGIPSCMDHYNILTYENITNFFTDMAGPPHNNMHTNMAGLYGCDRLISLRGYFTLRGGLFHG